MTTGASLAAQQIFVDRVNLVQVDVSVLDQHGAPVPDLAPGDFTIFEDGKQQKLIFFKVVDVRPAAPASATSVREVPSDILTNQTGDKRVMMIMLDDATIIQGFDPPFYSLCDPPPRVRCPPPACQRSDNANSDAGSGQRGRGGSAGSGGGSTPDPRDTRGCIDAGAIERAREAASKVVDQLGPDDLASVSFSSQSTPSQSLTQDRDRLEAAIDRFGPTETPSCLGFRRSIRTLQAMVDSVQSIAGRRNVIVYIGGGLPIDQTNERLLIDVDDADNCNGHDLQFELTDVFRRAAAANVAVYTIDPFGLRVWALPGTAAGGDVESQQTIAANTGGEAIVNTNEFGPGIDRMFAETSYSCILGYSPTNIREDGKRRRIEVKVDRPHVDVRHRSSYYARDTAAASGS